ncbi:Panacea domain-containing protein [Moraxella catarrhalis]|uniref:Panacea domain-containing protein n=2 Tax=Moraxella catarrhalis TaxID=480 RepID=UPI001D12C6CE|nr:type II toxin-antitoxin system antitoxin SocA domain-containing protein [Moraxella catarrhalis]
MAFLSHFEKGVVMIKAPYNPMDVANYIVAEAVRKEKPVTHLKLQKLLYYVVAKYLQTHNKPLIAENVVKWQYGPVVKSVYHHFKILGSLEITELCEYIESKDNKKLFSVKWADVDANVQTLKNNPEFTKVANTVIDDLLSVSAFGLVDITHAEAAWRNFEPEILQGFEPYYSEDELKAATYD